jgi:hypothetical protein
MKFLSQALEFFESLKQIVDISNRLTEEGLDDGGDFVVHPRWCCQPQGHVLIVSQMYGEALAQRGFFQCLRVEFPLYLGLHVQNVLAGAERIRAKVGAGTVRWSALHAAESDAVALSAHQTRHRVIGPGAGAVRRDDYHALCLRPLQPLLESQLNECLFAQTFNRLAFGRRSGQPERRLRFQNG